MPGVKRNPPARALPVRWDTRMERYELGPCRIVMSADPADPIHRGIFWPRDMADEAVEWDAAQRKAARTRP